jgi:hypothetical protein
MLRRSQLVELGKVVAHRVQDLKDRGIVFEFFGHSGCLDRCGTRSDGRGSRRGLSDRLLFPNRRLRFLARDFVFFRVQERQERLRFEFGHPQRRLRFLRRRPLKRDDARRFYASRFGASRFGARRFGDIRRRRLRREIHRLLVLDQREARGLEILDGALIAFPPFLHHTRTRIAHDQIAHHEREDLVAVV